MAGPNKYESILSLGLKWLVLYLAFFAAAMGRAFAKDLKNAQTFGQAADHIDSLKVGCKGETGATLREIQSATDPFAAAARHDSASVRIWKHDAENGMAQERRVERGNDKLTLYLDGQGQSFFGLKEEKILRQFSMQADGTLRLEKVERGESVEQFGERMEPGKDGRVIHVEGNKEQGVRSCSAYDYVSPKPGN